MTTELGNLSQCHGHDHDHTEPQNKDILGHGFALSYDNCSGVCPELKWSSCGTSEQLLLHCMQCSAVTVVLCWVAGVLLRLMVAMLWLRG